MNRVSWTGRLDRRSAASWLDRRSAAGWVDRRSAAGRRWLAFGTGLLSAIALPPVHAIPVLLLAVPLLLALIGRCRTARGAGLLGLLFGFGHHLIGLYWITEAILFEAARFWWLVPLAVPALSLVLAVFIAVPCALAHGASPGWSRALTFAGTWILADLARQFVATGFPWNPWGSVWAIPGPVGDVLLQPASLAGVHGLTLATLLLAATPLLGRRAMLGGAAAMLVWIGFGLWRLAETSGPAPAVTLVLVQGDIAQGQKWDRAFQMQTFRTYLELTRDGAAAARTQAPNTTVAVLWPETASPFLLDRDPDARSAILEAAGPGAVVLAGSVRFDADGAPRNSLLAVTSGPPDAIYDKWHLVPFGEYEPSWLPVPIQVVPGRGFAGGPGPRTLHVPGVPPVGPLICYEAIFQAQVTDESDRPGWLANGTNDAWFGNSSGPRQHLAAVRIRTVEEGLPLARAANTGISALFDSRGREVARLGMQMRGVLVQPLPGSDPPTLEARLGLWPALVLGLVLPLMSRILSANHRDRLKNLRKG